MKRAPKAALFSVSVMVFSILAFLTPVAVTFEEPGSAEALSPSALTREVFFNISSVLQLVFYSLALVAGVGLAVGFYDHLALWLRGKGENRFDNMRWRILGAFRDLPRNQSVVSGDAYAGVMHFLIMWGIIVLFIGTVLLTIHADTPFKFLVGINYLIYNITLDVFSVFLILGIVMAIVRRYGIKPKKLVSILDDAVILWGLFLVAVTGLLVEGLRLAITTPQWEFAWAPVGYLFGAPLMGLPEETLRSLHFAVWWTHAISTLTLIAYIPFSKLFHAVASALNVVFRSTYPKGWLPPQSLEQEGAVKDVVDLSWKRIMDLDACTVCGRCTDSCPATASGRLLQPMMIIQRMKAYAKDKYSLKARLLKPQRKSLVGEEGYIKPEELWGCTTCRACMEVCPVAIEHVYDIVDLRRQLMEEGDIPEGAMKILNLMQKTGNAYGLPQGKRAEWAKGLNVKDLSVGGSAEVVLFVGCLASFDPRAQKVARALVRVLQKAGVDFGILGKEEYCNGHEARRMGEEGLFEMLAEKNIKSFRKYGVKKIITISPHCYNAFRNDYPQKGLSLEVKHYTQFVAELLEQGVIKPTGRLNQTLTFHDPCYLGRHNSEYDAPRRILGAIPGVRVVEMGRCRENSFCCGGGGGGYWIEVEHQEKRMSEIRVEEAASLRPETLAVSCPFCLNNFEDAIKVTGRESQMASKDVIEILWEALEHDGAAAQIKP